MRTAIREFQGSSTTMLEIIKAFQEYVFDGLSLASYRERWVTK